MASALLQELSSKLTHGKLLSYYMQAARDYVQESKTVKLEHACDELTAGATPPN